jgi:hypothetical protein
MMANLGKENRRMVPEQLGAYYYCIKVTGDVSEDGEIYAYADRVVVTAAGTLVLFHVFTPREQAEEQEEMTLMIPGGKWLAVYAASSLDGSAVAVEHWADEIVEA